MKTLRPRLETVKRKLTDTKQKELKARKTLFEAIAARVTAAGNDPADPHDVMLEFSLSGLDYKGQVTSGFGDYGHAGTVEGGIDFGDLVAPGFVSLEATANVKGTKSSRALIAISQMPAAIPELKDEIWRTPNPVTLLILVGKYGKAELTLAAEAGIGLPDAINGAIESVNEHLSSYAPDIVSMELALGVTASAQTRVSGELMRLRDPHPKAFRNAFSSGLDKTIHAWLTESTRKDLKIEVAKWIEETANHVIPKTERDDFLKTITEGRRKGHWNTIDVLLPKLEKLKEELEGKYAPQLSKRTLFHARLDNYMKRLAYAYIAAHPKANPNGSSEAVQITNARVELKKRATQAASPPYDRLCFLNMWGAEGDAKVGVTAEAGFSFSGAKDSKLVKAEIEGDIGVSAGAQASGSLKRGSYRFQCWTTCDMQPLSDKGEKWPTQVTVQTQDTVLNYRQGSLSAEAEGHLKSSANLAANAQTYGGFEYDPNYEKVKEFERSKEVSRELVCNVLTYRSSVVYWIYKPQKSVSALTGSGLCLGMSVAYESLDDITRFAKNGGTELLLDNAILKDGKEDHRLKKARRTLQILAATLRIKKETLINALARSNDLGEPKREISDQREDLIAPDVVLLEVAARLPSGKSFDLKRPKGGKPDKPWELDENVLDQMNTYVAGGKRKNHVIPEKQLDALRIRYRIADTSEDTQAKFQLGFDFVFSIGIELNTLKTAAMEGIVDVETIWLGDPPPNLPKMPPKVYEGGELLESNGKQYWKDKETGKVFDLITLEELTPPADAKPVQEIEPAAMYEVGVPPVALFHQ